MARKTNNHQLSESWADVNEPEEEDIASVHSEEGFEPRIREAYYNSHGSSILPKSQNLNDRRAAQTSAQSSTARKRGASHMSGNSGFIMPSPESSVYVEKPSRKSPRQASRPATRATISRRSTPSRRLVSDAQPEKRARRSPSVPPQDEPQDYLKAIWMNVAAPLLRYVFSICSFAAGALKPLFGYALIVLLLAIGFGMARTAIVHSVSNVLSPLCNIPGAGYLNLPFCTPIQYGPSKGSPAFDKLMVTQSNFEGVLQDSVNQYSLPAAMKHSEIAIRDLRTSVKYSKLATRNELLNEFDNFVDTAQEASKGLSQFNSRISRALDGILVTNRWTLKLLEGIKATPDQGIVPRFFNKYLSALSLTLPHHDPADVIYDRYVHHTVEVDDQVQICISEANGLIGVLHHLDNQLETIKDIAYNEGMRVDASKEELLGLLWTKLGANQATLSKFEAQRETLNYVTAYRATALQHVSTTLLKLMDIQNNLKQLRDDIAAPGIVGRKNLPLNVHIELLGSAVDRLEAVRDAGTKEKQMLLRNSYERGDGDAQNKKIE